MLLRSAVRADSRVDQVLCVDWNRINDLVVSGGEDCVFKVSDGRGRKAQPAGMQRRLC